MQFELMRMYQVNPRVDLAFKKIFGVEENKDLLMSLINSIVSKKDQVADITLLNPYTPQNFKHDKFSILDIKAKGLGGKLFNIEIQIIDTADYDKRALYYWAKMYSEQLQSGRDYSNLNKAIGIHILNFISIPKAKKYHNVFKIKEQESDIDYFEDLELHTIELKKFADDSSHNLSGLVAKVKNALDMWVAFLTRHDLLDKNNLPGRLNDTSLKKALGILEILNLNTEERGAYEDHLKWLLTEEAGLKKAEKEGMAKGREEGERKKAIEIAKKMLKKSQSIEDIMELTELSSDDIKRLHDKTS